MSNFAITLRQRQLMQIVLEAADRGEFLSMKDIWSVEPDVRTLPAVYCSFRFLKKHNIVVLDKSAGGVTIVKPTLRAYTVMRGGM